MKKYVLIVAGGVGQRFGADLPKQFQLLQGKPVLVHVFMVFQKADSDIKYILVLPKAYLQYWKTVEINYGLNVNPVIVSGGTTRMDSVRAGLDYIPDGSIVAIHDGVRPLVSKRIIEEGFTLANEKGNAVPVAGIVDTVRIVEREGNRVLDREKIKLVQTPQFFKTGLIKKAYSTKSISAYTDDASALEQAGYKINLFKGDSSNIKITTRKDIVIAEALLGKEI